MAEWIPLIGLAAEQAGILYAGEIATIAGSVIGICSSIHVPNYDDDQNKIDQAKDFCDTIETGIDRFVKSKNIKLLNKHTGNLREKLKALKVL